MYRWLDHTSEMELSIAAETPEAVFREAMLALGELTAGEPIGEPIQREVSAGASDQPGLLAEWLNELIYLAESEGLVAERIVSIALTESRVEAVIAGRRSRPQGRVKGATYHRLEMGLAGGAWRARVILDV